MTEYIFKSELVDPPEINYSNDNAIGLVACVGGIDVNESNNAIINTVDGSEKVFPTGVVSLTAEPYYNVASNAGNLFDTDEPIESGSFLMKWTLRYGGTSHSVFKHTNFASNHRFYIEWADSKLKVRLGDGVEVESPATTAIQYDTLIVAVNWVKTTTTAWEAILYDEQFNILTTINGTCTTSPFSDQPENILFNTDRFYYLYLWNEYKTQAELLEVARSAYSIYKLNADVLTEKGLKISTASESVSIPFSGSYTGTLYYSDDTTSALSGSGTYTLDGSTPVFIKRIEATDNNGTHVFIFDLDSGNVVQSETSLLTADLVGFPTGGYFVSSDQPNSYLGFRMPAGTRVSKTIADKTITGVLKIKTRAQVKTNYLYAAMFSFLSTTNGVIVRNSGWYLRSAGNDGGVSFSTPLDPDTFYDIEFHLDPATKTASMFIDGQPEGVRTGYTIDLSVINRIRLNTRNGSTSGGGDYLYQTFSIEDDTGVLHNYDFTEPANPNKIIDTVGNEHLTITDENESGFLPITPIEVTTIGTGKDYPSLVSWQSAVKGLQGYYQKGLVYDNSSNGDIYIYDWNFDFGGGLYGQTENAVYTGKLFAYNSRLDLVDMTMGSIGGSAVNLVRTKAYTLSANGSSAAWNFGFKLTDSQITGVSNVDVVGINSIIKSRIISNGKLLELTNCLLTYSSQNHLWQGTYSSDTRLTNCIIRRNESLAAINVDENNQKGVNMDAWFDVDGNIIEAEQAQLTGTGFNNTNICEWAWVADVVAGAEVISSISGGGTLSTTLYIHKLLDAVVLGGGSTNISSEVSKLLGAVSVSGSADIISYLTSNRFSSLSVSTEANLNTAISAIKSILSDLSSNGGVQSSIGSSKTGTSLVTAAVRINTLLSAIKSLNAVVSAGGSINSTATKEVISDASIAIALTGGGTISQGLSTSKYSIPSISGTGSVLNILNGHKEVGSSITSSTGIASIIHKTTPLGSEVSSGTTASSTIFSNKGLAADISTTGSVVIALHKGVGTISEVSGNGDLEVYPFSYKETDTLTISGNGEITSVAFKDLEDLSNVVHVEISVVAEAPKHFYEITSNGVAIRLEAVNPNAKL